MFSHFYLVYLRQFLNHTVVLFGPFWRPRRPSALGSRLDQLMAAPARIVLREMRIAKLQETLAKEFAQSQTVLGMFFYAEDEILSCRGPLLTSLKRRRSSNTSST